jgi:chemotaxis signal transduction protein
MIETAAVAGSELRSHYVVELSGNLYALPQLDDMVLSWVQRPQEPTYLPTLPSWCLGLVNARNTPVLLVDPHALLGLPPQESREADTHARQVFVESRGEIIGFLVDRTRRFRMLPAQPWPVDGELVVGVVHDSGDAIRVLNLPAIWRLILSKLAEGGAAA